MLKIIVPLEEYFDNDTQEFVIKGDELELEHSLVSLSKWEMEFRKPFLSKEEKTEEEVLAYIKYMTLTPEISPEVFSRLSAQNYAEINDYLEAKPTATWFNEPPGSSKGSDAITNELIYYWLIAFNIPFECQYWHLDRLFTLIRICNAKNAPPKKMSARQIAERNQRLNAERKKQLGTRG